MVASVIDRPTDNYFAVVLPGKNAYEDTGSVLLAEAGVLLSAQVFSNELHHRHALTAPAEAAQRVRDRLRFPGPCGRAQAWDAEDGEDDGWDEEGGELTARTAAVLRVPLEELSGQAWQDVAEVGDAPLGRGEGRVLGLLPSVTLRQDRNWRWQGWTRTVATSTGTGARMFCSRIATC
ncbi:hypothetical protein [Streptomyces albogriseolus]|uniref:hypothetical protein n=1 Tax=Streptomyces albogriseolus TaxID=1887 RepID=UPI0034606228